MGVGQLEIAKDTFDSYQYIDILRKKNTQRLELNIE